MMCDGSTPLILAGHGLEGVADPTWPVSFYELNRYFPNIGFQDRQPEEVIAPFGIFPIHPSDKPEGDVVEKAEPLFVEGTGYVQQWTSRDYTPEEAATALANEKQNLMWKLDTILQATYDRGFDHNHADGVEKFSLTADNRQLITGIYLLAQTETDAERKFRLRTFDNTTVQYSVEDMKVLGKAVMEYISAVLNQLWDLMDQINNATKLADLPKVPDYIEVA